MTTGSCAVVFADISGSTRLYQTVGDQRAQAVISACLTCMTVAAECHGGVLIKTIGDEIMCRFETADAALHAACRMQEALRGEALAGRVPVSVHIGMHFGPVILRGRDVFGDAVNVGARLRDVAKAGQIITTAETIAVASNDIRDKARRVDRAVLPGRSAATDLYEVLWDPIANVTMLAQTVEPAGQQGATLVISHLSATRRMSSTETLRIGRDPDCDVVIVSELASRQHARLEFRRGKFVLTDQSTNGTFVEMAGAPEVYLRRESVPLTGRGVIGLGRSCASGEDHLVRFSCE